MIGEQMTKMCIDCKHFNGNFGFDTCNRAVMKIENMPVKPDTFLTGGVRAQFERNAIGLHQCGAEGKFFEKRKQNLPALFVNQPPQKKWYKFW